MKTFQEFLEENHPFQIPVKINSPGHPNHGKTGVVSGIHSQDSVKVKLADGSHSWHKQSELES